MKLEPRVVDTRRPVYPVHYSGFWFVVETQTANKSSFMKKDYLWWNHHGGLARRIGHWKRTCARTEVT